MVRFLSALLAATSLAATTLAAPGVTGPFPFPTPNPATLLAVGSADALAGVFRGQLVKNAPPVLYEKSFGWGDTIHAADGVTWTGKVAPLRPHLRYTERNDGDWRKVHVTAPGLADTLVLEVRKVNLSEPGKLTFTLFVSFDARVDYEHQKWLSGVRLYSGSARARLRAKATLDVEVTTRLEANGTPLPDAVFKPRVVKADLGYDNLVMEHVAGVGGEAAKVIGDGLKGGLHQWRPSVERDLLQRADAAIVKAGDLKEVRINLARLFTGSGK
jgi:hypothetical protein